MGHTTARPQAPNRTDAAVAAWAFTTADLAAALCQLPADDWLWASADPWADASLQLLTMLQHDAKSRRKPRLRLIVSQPRRSIPFRIRSWIRARAYQAAAWEFTVRQAVVLHPGLVRP